MIKKFLLILVIAVFCNQAACAMIQKKVMPNEENLEKYFLNYELLYFASHTDIIYKLAGNKLSRDEIEKILNEVLADCRTHLQISMIPQNSPTQFSCLYDFIDEELESVRKQLEPFVEKIWAEC